MVGYQEVAVAVGAGLVLVWVLSAVVQGDSITEVAPAVLVGLGLFFLVIPLYFDAGSAVNAGLIGLAVIIGVLLFVDTALKPIF
ncbi:hypothetical protein [Natronorubrum sp. DTA7]|uniref:hypothetical protein n=1 Tax=Natronorubrum sp. DTA7 TaxID=3447016 RepID=UPI003F8660E1